MENKFGKKELKLNKHKQLSAKSSVDSKNPELRNQKPIRNSVEIENNSVNRSAYWEQNKSKYNKIDKDLKTDINRKRNNSIVNKLNIPIKSKNTVFIYLNSLLKVILIDKGKIRLLHVLKIHLVMYTKTQRKGEIIKICRL